MTEKANAAVTYIVGPTEQDICDLVESLRLLDDNFNIQYQYPVILFHENFDDSTIGFIKSRSRSPLIFEKIKLDFPPHINPDSVPEDYMGFSIGYRHMCRWCSWDFFWHPRVINLDYAWHVDSDSKLLRPVGYDVFRYMEQNSKVYGYQIVYKEQPFACVGFKEFIKAYFDKNNILPRSFPEWFDSNGLWTGAYFYSDFSISDLRFFRSKLYGDYFKAADETGGIYKHRWGDTILCSLAVAAFLEPYQVHQFKDIGWSHQSFINP